MCTARHTIWAGALASTRCDAALSAASASKMCGCITVCRSTDTYNTAEVHACSVRSVNLLRWVAYFAAFDHHSDAFCAVVHSSDSFWTSFGNFSQFEKPPQTHRWRQCGWHAVSRAAPCSAIAGATATGACCRTRSSTLPHRAWLPTTWLITVCAATSQRPSSPGGVAVAQ